ncbi:MAG: hypothetical protein ACO37H_03315 [Burkholderiaceae bacterium]|jgi:hypothetical protein
MMSLREIQAFHAFFLAGTLLWCIAQMTPGALAFEVPRLSDVTKALHYQPRTPPPVFEPEYLDVSTDSLEYGDPIH